MHTVAPYGVVMRDITLPQMNTLKALTFCTRAVPLLILLRNSIQPCIPTLCQIRLIAYLKHAIYADECRTCFFPASLALAASMATFHAQMQDRRPTLRKVIECLDQECDLGSHRRKLNCAWSLSKRDSVHNSRCFSCC